MMRLLRALAPVWALLIALVVAAPAQASFAGGNGVLAVVALHGGAVVLTDTHGRHRTAVCTDASLCGRPVVARFAPNGGDLAFVDARTRAAGVAALDGTCMWCLLGPQLTGLTAAASTFTADGKAVVVAGPTGVWRVALSGGAARRLSALSATDVVWSTNGTFAFVHAGAIWVAPRGHGARRLANGTAPDLSPNSRQLVFAHAGWVWTVSVSGGAPRRLVRGSAPVYSPDGRSLAFIGGGGRVLVAGTLGRHAHLVPGVRGRALDWQPVPRRPVNRCRVLAGSSLVAQSAEAVVTLNPGTPFQPWYGCLQATGARVPLVALSAAGAGDRTTLAGLALAGRFATFVTAYSDKFGNCSNTVYRTDLAAGTTKQFYSVDCSTARRGVDSLAADSSGFAAWRATEQVNTPQPLVALACASSTLCVSADGLGNAAYSTSPAAGTWSLGHVAASFSGIACAPASTFCVGWVGGSVMTTSDPTTGVWSAPTAIDPGQQIADVTCRSTSLCVAVDGAGNAIATTNPTGGAAAWTSTAIDPGAFLDGVSCPQSTFCVTVGENADVLVSSQPALGKWTKNPVPAEANVSAVGGVGCVPGSTRCISTDPNGNILTTTDPALPNAWVPTAVSGASFIGQHEPVCASATLCLASSGAGNVLVSTQPFAGSPTWTSVPIAASIAAIACAPSPGTLCLATDRQGTVFSSTNPTATWTPASVDVPSCGACIAEQLYVQDDRGQQAVDIALPGTGNVIEGVALSGNSTAVTWTHGGSAARFALR